MSHQNKFLNEGQKKGGEREGEWEGKEEEEEEELSESKVNFLADGHTSHWSPDQ